MDVRWNDGVYMVGCAGTVQVVRTDEVMTANEVRQGTFGKRLKSRTNRKSDGKSIAR